MKPLRTMPRWYLPLLLLLVTPIMEFVLLLIFVNMAVSYHYEPQAAPALMPAVKLYTFIFTGVTTALTIVELDSVVRQKPDDPQNVGNK